MIALIALGAIAVIALPHTLPLHRAPPASAAALWAVSLGMRAVVAVFAALYLVFLLPGTELFAVLTRWCTHAIVPLLSAHLGISGHRLGDALTVVPALTLLGSALGIAVGVARGARAVRRLVRHTALGAGPGDSVIVKGSEVVLLAAGLKHPRVLVSAGALAELEDDELAAGLEHERGHIIRRHRFVLMFGELCRALARWQPGIEVASRQLAFQLERDADAWVIWRHHDPAALAGAICKSALSFGRPGPALASLGGASAVSQRIQALVDAPASLARTRSSALNAAATAGAALVVFLAASIPAAVAVGQSARDPVPPESGQERYRERDFPEISRAPIAKAKAGASSHSLYVYSLRPGTPADSHPR